MSALTLAVEGIKPQVASELASLSAAARRRKIKQMSRQAGRDADAVRASLASRGECDEAVWQAEIAAVEAPYFAALELFRDDCPRGEE